MIRCRRTKEKVVSAVFSDREESIEEIAIYSKYMLPKLETQQCSRQFEVEVEKALWTIVGVQFVSNI